MKAQEMKEATGGIDIAALVSVASRASEKKCKLSPVFLSRDSFAANATTIGSLELDRIIGGGVPPSRILGISGPEHSGKSLIATEIRQGIDVYFDCIIHANPAPKSKIVTWLHDVSLFYSFIVYSWSLAILQL